MTKIFKFGGASVKDAEAVKNVGEVIKLYQDDLIIVLSAMGKTTNNLEKVVESYLNKDGNVEANLQVVKDFHTNILNELFENKKHPIFNEVHNTFVEIEWEIEEDAVRGYDYVYDQIVSVGEVLSTKIVSAYLNLNGLKNKWQDVRNLIQSDNTHRNANVDWELTEQLIQKDVAHQFNTAEQTIIITQGFIASSSELFTTTLGREGSDFTAGILAYCLNPESVTIWKDVPGVLNADPRVFKKTQLLEKISYTEAIELAFYGASVIHPKTLQPLQKKEIPLYVKSFLNPNSIGTAISRGVKIEPEVPCFIVKRNLNLLKLSSLDFSFIVEENISEIFQILHENKMKVDLIQNSAISFSVCIYDKFNRLKELLSILKATFKVECIEQVSLFTIRHFEKDSANEILKNNQLLLEQRTKEILQLVVR